MQQYVQVDVENAAGFPGKLQVDISIHPDGRVSFAVRTPPGSDSLGALCETATRPLLDALGTCLTHEHPPESFASDWQCTGITGAPPKPAPMTSITRVPELARPLPPAARKHYDTIDLARLGLRDLVLAHRHDRERITWSLDASTAATTSPHHGLRVGGHVVAAASLDVLVRQGEQLHWVPLDAFAKHLGLTLTCSRCGADLLLAPSGACSRETGRPLEHVVTSSGRRLFADWRAAVMLTPDVPAIQTKANPDSCAAKDRFNVARSAAHGRSRICSEASEDRLTWLLFRGLELLGLTENFARWAFPDWPALRASRLRETQYWGRAAMREGLAPEVDRALAQLEPFHTAQRLQRTETDAALVFDQGRIMVEAKLGVPSEDAPTGWEHGGGAPRPEYEPYVRPLLRKAEQDAWAHHLSEYFQPLRQLALGHLLEGGASDKTGLLLLVNEPFDHGAYAHRVAYAELMRLLVVPTALVRMVSWQSVLAWLREQEPSPLLTNIASPSRSARCFARRQRATVCRPLGAPRAHRASVGSAARFLTRRRRLRRRAPRLPAKTALRIPRRRRVHAAPRARGRASDDLAFNDASTPDGGGSPHGEHGSMTSAPYELLDGHIVAHVDGLRVLVDTGSPSTFGRVSSVALAGRTFPVARTHGGLSIEMISELVGTSLDVLLGSDVLRETGLIIDARTAVVRFEEPDAPAGAIASKASFELVPILDVAIGSRHVRAVFDTGAKISYALPELLASPTGGEVNDFYPGVGRFTARTHRASVQREGTTFELEVGAMTVPRVQAVLSSLGLQAILGTDVLSYFPFVAFAPFRGQVIACRQDQLSAAPTSTNRLQEN